MLRKLANSQCGSQSRRIFSRNVTYSPKPVVGIKRETVNLWEQRSPITPAQVKQLIRATGAHVLVQPSNRRCFSEAEYESCGAVIQEDLGEASLIMGVKRPTQLRESDLLPKKTYSFFTHTIKAQPDNMGLLDTLLERDIRILDYECMVDSTNQRLVAFGKFAGYAGTIDILNGLGIRLLAMGFQTPFLQIGMAHNYTNTGQALEAVRLAGYEVARNRLPDSLGPLVFIIHGDGNVAQGAQAIMEALPVQYVEPSQLSEVTKNGKKDVIYLAVVNASHYMEHVDGKPFVMSEYFQQPEKYKSKFIEKIAPYMSVLINSTYWDARIDKILTHQNVKSLLNIKPSVKGSPTDEAQPTLPYRLLAICDISADPGGSVEFTNECTTIDEPFELYNPMTNTTERSVVGDGILMCSIDNLPTQLPFEASEHFGNVLFPFIKDMINSDATKPFEKYEACPEVKNAMITSNGKLTPKFEYINKLRAETCVGSATASSEKKVLVLGSGYVVPPLLEYLSRNGRNKLTVASNAQQELAEISNKFRHIQMENVNILEDNKALSRLVKQHDLVVSLIPWKFHPAVIQECINQKRNILTASYCTPALKEMEKQIDASGITAFMEIGLDPGIDHLLTKECIDDVGGDGGSVVSYRSYTGGVPAPESSNNPLRYKFSWSPEAAMSTVMNGAKYLEEGKIKEIPSDGSLMKMAKPMDIFPGFNLEGYPNRDSTRYIDLYGLKNCQTVIRGTLRFSGYTEAVSFLIGLGLLNGTAEATFRSGSPQMKWRQLICKKLGLKESLSGLDLENAILKKVGGDIKKYKCLYELGFLSEDLVAQKDTPLASTCAQLGKFLSYGPNERDLIIMAHELIIDWPSKKQIETRNVSLVAYGNPGEGKAGLAMSRTVGIPAGIAAQMILDGEVPDRGIVLPLKPHLYKPILKRLKEIGIQALETSTFTAK